MSGTKVKGIIVEIGGDTTSLSKAINSVSADARSTQSELKKIEKLLKMDPAMMTGPLMSTVVDAVSLLIYFALANALIPNI